MEHNLTIKEYDLETNEIMPLALFVFSDKLEEFPKESIKDETIEKLYHRIVQDKQITGKAGEAPYIYSLDSNFNNFYFIGIGKSTEDDLENFRVAGAALCRRLRKFSMNKIAIKFPTLQGAVADKIQAFTEGFMLRNYDFSK